MTDDTHIFKKEDSTEQPEPPSLWRGISIRGWLAVMLVATACIVQIGDCMVDFAAGRHVALDNTFMMLVASVLAHYFASKPQSPPGTTSQSIVTTQTPSTP